MGKIFTPEEIRLGAIPEAGAHLQAAHYIVDQLFYEQNAFRTHPNQYIETGIDAGLIHGSATHGTATVRSDLDVAIVFRDDVSTLDTIHEVFTDVEKVYNVPVEVSMVHHSDAMDHLHNIDPLFLRYLIEAEANPEFSWNWPAEKLCGIGVTMKEEPKDITRVVLRYIAAKNASFAKATVLDGELDMHKLQRALELPKNLGRNILSMADSTFSAAHATGDEIVDGLNDFLDKRAFSYEPDYAEQIKQGLKSLLQEDEAYTRLLEDTLSGETTLATYEDWLNERKRDLVIRALLVCAPIADSVRRYAREITTEDWETQKAEIEKSVLEPPSFEFEGWVTY